MEELRVLVLSGIDLQSLPSSIKCLPNLRMLCLEKCTLRDLSVLNHLRKLRILSLSGSRIKDWPTVLEGLRKLQLLDISDCFISSSTKSLSLSSFPNLEELYIENSLTKMEVKGQINHSQISALSELKHLHQLNTLDVYIPSAELLPADLFFHELNDYKIVIGDFETISIADFKMPKKYEASRSLALQLEPGMDIHSLKGVKLLLKGVVNFLLGELHGVQNVFYELNLDGFPDLKHFSIVNNNDIEYIVNSMELSQPHDAFPSLEFLSLFNLKNIKKICCSPITSSSFSRLKIIKVKMCPQLKSIFFFYIVEFLTSLETIDVSECDSLQAVISKEEGSKKVVLHKLCSLTLQKLPSFVSFYNNADMPLEPESMEKQARITDDIGIVPAEDEQSSTTSFSLFDENVEIPNLESLKLFSIKIHSIWSDRISNDWFQNLIKLTLIDCNLTYLCSLSMARSLNKLKSISISECSLMEKLFISEENNNEYSKDCIFPKLEEIQLSRMEMLKEIWPREDEQVWSEDPKGVVNFTNVRSIEISSCNTLSNVLPASIAKDLGKLESFWIYSCRNLEEIIAYDGGSETSSEALEFPEVVSMSFSNLPSIRCLYKGRHIVECPKLKQLRMTGCPNLEIFKTESANEQETAFLSPEKVMSNLEHLTIDSKGLEWLMSNTRKYRFTSLKQLYLHTWQSHHDQTLYCFLHTIPNLQIFELIFNSNIREFVPSGNTAPKQRLGTVLLLKELTLWAREMEDIGFERDPALQRSLHRLKLQFCHRLRRLAHSSVSFTHLTYLQVYHCGELKTLMTCSTAKSLVQLTTLKVEYCDQLNEIVTKDEQENDEGIKIVFANLITIQLERLSNLTSFCSNWNCEFSVPLLEKLILRECPKMKTFTTKHITAPKLQSVLGEEEKGYWKRDLNATIQMYKVHLELSHHPDLKQVWCDKTWVQVNRFQNVKSLIVKKCGYLVHVIPSHLLHCFKNLEDLHVSDCHGVQVIFNMDESNNKQVTKATGLPRLKKLSLKNLPNLEHVWDKDSREIIHFSALQDLSIDKCDSLKYVFPTSIAKDLAMLNNLSIKDCEQMVKIFVELGDTKTFELPSLASLVLRELPMLKHFYPGLHKLQFPKLKELYIQVCKWMILNCQEAEIFVDQQVLLPIEKVNLLFQSLEKLSFDMRGAKLTWEVKSRKLEFEESEERVEEVLFEKKPKADYVQLLLHLALKGLSISSLYKLKSIGLDHSWIHPILDNIQTLEVKYCYDIKNLVASKVSFSSLTKLDIYRCDDLLYLFTSSAAESLSQLKHMQISDCKSMREIVSNDESSGNIIFERLQILHLEELPMLRWLYSGKRTLCFPSLQQLSIFGRILWRMTTFCPHIHINPDSVKLHSGRSKYESYGVQWEDDVDTTIRKMNNKKIIGLRENLYVQDMWRDSMPVSEAYFVQKCSSVKTIFDVKCITKDKTLLPIKFSLEELVLEKLPNLDSIWNEDPDGVLDFQLIQQVRVDTCKSLTSLFPKSVAKDLVNLKNLELKHCKSLVEIIVGIATTPERAISNLIKFPRLTSLTLLDLPSFNCFYCSLHCVLLKTLNGHDPQIEDQVCFKEITPKLTNMLFGEREAKMIGHEECDRSHFGDINVSDMQSFNVELESDELSYTFLQKDLNALGYENHQFSKLWMESFCEGTINTNKLSEVVFDDSFNGVRIPLEVDLNSTLRNTYKTEVATFVREVKDLKLNEHPIIHGIWNGPFQVPSLCFIRLKILIVEKCEFMCIVIPSHILSLLCKLEELVVRQCESVKTIFEVTREAKDTKINPLRSGLKKLTIEQLPNLEHVWDSDPTQQVCYFESLQEVYVHGCNNLQRLFPISVAENLNKLEKLEVTECDRLVEIVAKDEAIIEGAAKEFALQSMTSIKLRSLPELECFYPAPYKLECPKLEKVHLFHCDKLKTFQFESQEFQCPQAENQAIFLPEKVIPYLKFLAVSKEEITMMLHVNNLSKLEALQLQCFHDDSDTLPYEFLQRLPNIEKLVVCCSSFKEIICTKRPTMDCVKEIIPQVKCLQLSSLSQLNSIGLEHSWVQHISENIEKLQMDKCHSLRSIVPSEVSFSNLIELNISECNGLVNLFTPSTSRTLQQLKNMSIENCESLKEIVSEEEVEESSGHVGEEIIVFHKLKTLSLCSLPNLGRFYNGNIGLKFPSLVHLLLIDCSKMESFCAGTVSVNRWMEVQFKDEEDIEVVPFDDMGEKHAFLVEDDLNCAVRKVFEGIRRYADINTKSAIRSD
ncbi:hypothetical protein AAHE18_02G167300 [Arachis hypogaea]